MSIRNSITRDLHDSIRHVTGPKVKISLSCMAKLETKTEKLENRVLVFTSCRLLIFTSKVPTKIDFHIHYLDLQSIESKKNNVMTIGAKDKFHTFHTFDTEDSSTMVDGMVKTVVHEILDLFPGYPLGHFIRRLDVVPASRIPPIMPKDITGHDPGPCGNFSRQYACTCDYLGASYREEVAWDIDTIYHAHETKELNLKDFDHLDVRDLVPVIAALEHNKHFTSLRLGTTKLSHEAIEKLLYIARKSPTLQELHLDSANLKMDFAHKLSLAIIANPNCALHTIDLSHNHIEDKGVSHLANAFGKQETGLQALLLAHCGLTGKGLDKLAHSFGLNQILKCTLKRLDLSGNILKDDISHICTFLAQPNVLVSLNLSFTESSIEPVFGALVRGCTSHLTHLNLSRCCFVTKKGKELPPSFKQFFSSTIALKYLSMAGTRVPPEALKGLLLGLACNDGIDSVELDLSGNALSAIGAHVLDSCVHGVRSVSVLDISDNGLEGELANIMASASKNKCLRTLNISRNLQNLKAKHVAAVVESIVNLLQEEDCSLEVLLMSDCKLKCEAYGVINALETNRSLVKLDISGNFIGDAGARLLGKALQINTSLHTLVIDRNTLGCQGLCDIVYALESNRSLRNVPIPLHDIAALQKSNLERTEQIVRQLQELLFRNSSLPSRTSAHAFRLQHGFQINSTHQTVDRLYSQTAEALRNKEISDPDSPVIPGALAVLSDASNAKQLLRQLYELTRKDDNTELVKRLAASSSELHRCITSQLQATIQNTLSYAESRCPELFRAANLAESLQAALEAKSTVEPEFVLSSLRDKCGPELAAKVNEVTLSLISTVSERVVEETIHALSKTYKALVGGGRHRNSTPDALRTSINRLSAQSSSPSAEERLSLTENDKLGTSPVATPTLSSMRRSQQSRKLRPKSVVDSMNHAISAEVISDSVHASGPEPSPGLNRYLAVTTPSSNHGASISEPVPITASYDDLSSVLESLKSETLKSGDSTPFGSWSASPARSIPTSPTVHLSIAEEENGDASVSEMPLRHLGLNRPKRLKTRLPTKPAVRNPDGPLSLGTLSPEMELSEGFDSFFGVNLASGSGATSATSLGSISEERVWSRNASTDSSPQHRPSSIAREISAREEKKSSSLPRTSDSKQVTRISAGVSEVLENKLKKEKGAERRETKSKEELSGKEQHKEESPKEESFPKRKSSGGVKLLSSIFGRATSSSDVKDELADEKKSPLAGKKTRNSPLPAKAEHVVSEKSTEEAKADEKVELRTEVPKFKIGAEAPNAFLSDLKTRQDKRSSFFTTKQSSEEEKQDAPEKPKVTDELANGVPGKIKMRMSAFSDTRNSEAEPPLPPKPGKALLKAPPLAPKPRPWSFASPDKPIGEADLPRAREKTPETLPPPDEKEEVNGALDQPKMSVKELAASLNKKPEDGKSGAAPLKPKNSPLLQDDMTRSCHAAFGDFIQDVKGIKKLVTDDDEELGDNVTDTHGTISSISIRESAKKPSGDPIKFRLERERITADDIVNV